MWWRIYIFKNMILIWKLSFCHWLQTLSVVFLEVIILTFHFEKVKYPDCWFFLQVNMVFHDKGSWRAHSQPSTYPSSFWAPAHVCPVHSCCSTSQTMEKMSPQGTRWAEVYPLLSQGHAQAKLAVDVFVFVVSMWRWRTGTVCLRLPQPWVQLTPQEAVPWPLWICQSYRQILSSVILKIVFNFTDPWEILRDSRCLPTISGVIWAQWI